MKKKYCKPEVSSRKIEAGVFGNYGSPGNSGHNNPLPFVNNPHFPGQGNPPNLWP